MDDDGPPADPVRVLGGRSGPGPGRQIKSGSWEADQQLRSDQRCAVLSRMAAAAVVPSSSTTPNTTSSVAAAVVVRRPRADEDPLLIEALRDRNAAAAAAAAAWMFVNERARSCSSTGIMVQPSRS